MPAYFKSHAGDVHPYHAPIKHEHDMVAAVWVMEGQKGLGHLWWWPLSILWGLGGALAPTRIHFSLVSLRWRLQLWSSHRWGTSEQLLGPSVSCGLPGPCRVPGTPESWKCKGQYHITRSVKWMSATVHEEHQCKCLIAWLGIPVNLAQQPQHANQPSSVPILSCLGHTQPWGPLMQTLVC